MPIYEYKCVDCGETFEVIQKISENKLTNCKCGNDGKVQRLVSSSGFRLKGSGWYETDFKKNINNHEKKSETKSNKNV